MKQQITSTKHQTIPNCQVPMTYEWTAYMDHSAICDLNLFVI